MADCGFLSFHNCQNTFWQSFCPFKTDRKWIENFSRITCISSKFKGQDKALPPCPHSLTHSTWMSTKSMYVGLWDVTVLHSSLSPLSLALSLPEKAQIWEEWITDLKHYSRCYWCICQIPPPIIGSVGCQLAHTYILLWNIVFGQCEPLGDAQEANVQPSRPMSNWFSGNKSWVPLFQYKPSSVIQIITYRSPMGSGWTILQLHHSLT